MKNFIVVFSKDNARIIKGINPSDWQNVPGVALNPDLSEVKGIPPHHWKLVDSKVVPKPEDQRETPVHKIVEHKINIDKAHFNNSLKSFRWKTVTLCLVLSIFCSVLLNLFWK